MRQVKRVVILQPGYLPWLGFFDQLDLADEFVMYDDVQYDRRGWRNRNRIKTPDGPCWLTVPVTQKGRFTQSLLETRVCYDTAWPEKHLKTIHRYYSPAPYFADLYSVVQEVLQTRHEFLVDLDLALIHGLAGRLGIATKLWRSSELNIYGGKTERLLDICLHLGATAYLTGNAAHNYIDLDRFTEQGIEVQFHDYEHPRYEQLHGEFVPYLSIIDLMFNHGPDSLARLTSRGKGRF